MSEWEESDDLELEPEARRRRGIYLLPNLFTTGTLFAGFFAALCAIEEQYTKAAIAVFIGMVCDMLDGRIARLTNTQSDFGKEYDSLADMCCFGLAPALVMYQWSLHALTDFGRYGQQIAWAAAFFYAAMAALRLARFNVLATSGKGDKRFFYGLPSPAAAAFTMGFVWVAVEDFDYSGEDLLIPALIVTLLAGTFMVWGRIRYPSFKDLKVNERVPFRYMLLMVIAFVLIVLDPVHVLPGLIFIYFLSGPAIAFTSWRKARKAQQPVST
ncbi:MAG: CDP-alcohol phosphatidyltransferase family protein [Nevskiales bacterium]